MGRGGSMAGHAFFDSKCLGKRLLPFQGLGSQAQSAIHPVSHSGGVWGRENLTSALFVFGDRGRSRKQKASPFRKLGTNRLPTSARDGVTGKGV